MDKKTGEIRQKPNRWSFDGKILEKDDLIRYYDYARKEIEREDKLAYERTVTTLTFQGFLLTAISLMIGSINSFTLLPGYKIIIIIMICFAGSLLSYLSAIGIAFSRKSIQEVKDEWIRFNRDNGYVFPDLLPQITYKSDEEFSETNKAYSGIFKRSWSFFKNINQEHSKYIDTFGRSMKSDAGGTYFMSVPYIMLLFWNISILYFSVLGVIKLFSKDALF